MQSQVLNAQREYVYKVRLYNPMTDEFTISRRMATKAGADIMGGTIIENTRVLISSDQLEDMAGWTARDFYPTA